MNKKIVIIGSFMSVFLLMMLPSVSSVEYKIAEEVNKSNLIEQIKNLDVNKLKDRLKDNLRSIFVLFLFLGIGIISIEVQVTCTEGMTGNSNTTGLLLLFFIL